MIYYIPYNNKFTWDTFKHSIIRIKSIKPVEDIVHSNITYKHIDSFLQETYENKNIITKSFKKLGNYISCGTNSKFCLNINDFHKNAKVYYVFDLNKKICYQKCFCTCEKQKPFTNCRNFKSKPEPVPYSLISYLTSF